MNIKRFSLGLMQCIIISLLCSGHSIEKAPLHKKKSSPIVMCVTMPKCGTHLLLKCISLFNIPRMQFPYNRANALKPSPAKWKKYNALNRFDPPHHYKGPLHIPTAGPLPQNLLLAFHSKIRDLLSCHLVYSPQAEAFLDKHSKANFLIIRDPRAMLVSMAHMVKDGWHGEHANVEDIIWDFIDGRQKHFIRWGVTVNIAYPLIWELGVTEFYKLYLPWMQKKNFYTVRFEQLIGAQGGGSNELQLQEINNIAKHMGLTLPIEKLKAVRDELFGGTATFREGKITGWQKIFTPEMKAAYKAVPGANQLLIDLGYEQDANW